MATRTQYLYGDPRPVLANFDVGDDTLSIKSGDFIKQNADGTVAVLSSGAVTGFLGVAAQDFTAQATNALNKIFGNASPGTIRVNTDGTFEVDRSDTIALVVGDVVGPTGAQSVAKVADETLSLARVVEASPANATRVRIKINSARVPAAKTT